MALLVGGKTRGPPGVGRPSISLLHPRALIFEITCVMTHPITHLHISVGSHLSTPFSSVCSRIHITPHFLHHLNAHRAPTLASLRITKNAFITLHHLNASRCARIFHKKRALSRSEYMHNYLISRYGLVHRKLW